MKKLITIVPLMLMIFGASACSFVSVKDNEENGNNSPIYNEYRIVFEAENERAENEPSKTEPKCEDEPRTETEKENGKCTEQTDKNETEKNWCKMKRVPQEFEMSFDEFEVEVIVEFDSSVGFTVEKTHGVVKGVPYGTTTYANFSFEADTEKAQYFSYKVYDENGYVIDRGTVFIGNGEKQEICSLLPINRNTNYRVYIFGDE